MATKKALPGIFNAPNVKAPRPKPSSTGFKWPERRGVTKDHRRAFSVFMRKRMEETNQTHITLAKTWWGVTEVGGTNGQLIAKWLRMEQMPSRILAERVAEYFKCSLEDMLADNDRYSDPSHLIVSKSGQPLGAPAKPAKAARAKKAKAAAAVAEPVVATADKKTYTKKKATPTNGHVVQIIDSRWVIPAGVPAPRLSFEVGPDTPPGMAKVQVDGYFPIDIGHALVTMGADHKPASPRREVPAAVHTPLVEQKPALPESGG